MKLAGKFFFSRIDICKGYWQVPLQEDYKQYTAFVTPFDVYEYNRLPFGWKNSGAWFQKMMNCILDESLGKFCNVYIDDITIHSRTSKEHEKNISCVLEALSKSKLKISRKKSEFFQKNVTFLGRVFDGKTRTTKEESAQRIKKLVMPYDLHSLHVFLGLASHFRAFIKDYVAKTWCLPNLTQEDVPFGWSNECEKAYQYLVEAISSDSVLVLPDFNVPF